MGDRELRESEKVVIGNIVEMLKLNNMIWNGRFSIVDVEEEVDFLIQKLETVKNIYKKEERQ